MPCIELYLDSEDLKFLINFLNQDPEVAFIIHDGFNLRNKWIAVKEIDNYSLERFCLWHIPSGPLPLLTEDVEVREIILDPFAGWEEKRTGRRQGCPYFGAGHVGIIWLNNRTKNESVIGLSSFEWIGNHYRIIGFPAPIATEKWWKSLRTRISKLATKMARFEGVRPEVNCFPGAFEKIKNGMERNNKY